MIRAHPLDGRYYRPGLDWKLLRAWRAVDYEDANGKLYRIIYAMPRSKAQTGMAKRTQASVHYTDDGGTRTARCGNCAMYRSPHRCTDVQGDIHPTGKCDIWARD